MKVPTTLSLRPSASKSTSSTQSSSTQDTMPQVKRTISQTFSRSSDAGSASSASLRGTGPAIQQHSQKERRTETEDVTENSSSSCRRLLRRASTVTSRSVRKHVSSHFKNRQDTATRDSAQALYDTPEDAPLVQVAEGRMKMSAFRGIVNMATPSKRRRGAASGPSGEEGRWNPPAAPMPASYIHPAFNLDPQSGRAAKAAAAAYSNLRASDSGTSFQLPPQSPASTRDDESAVYLDDMPEVDYSIRCDFVRVIPPELSLEIFGYLDVQSLARCESVNRQWNFLATAPSAWQHLFRTKYEPKVHVSPTPIQMGGLGYGELIPGQDWKLMTKARRIIERRWAGERASAVYLNGHTDSVYCCQFDEKKIITGSRDRTIRVWDIDTYKCIKVIGGPAAKPTTNINPPLPMVECTHSNVESANGTPYGDSIFFTPDDFHSQSILCLQYDDDLMVTGSSDTTCIVWDVKTFRPIRRLRRHTAGVLDVCLDANYIISCSKDATICVWGRESGELLHVLYGHRGPVNAVQMRGNLLVSASGDGVAKLWELSSAKCIKEFISVEGGLAAVEFTDDAKYVLAGGNNMVVYKFDVTTGERLHTYQGHAGLVRSLFVDAPNNLVVSGSYDQSIQVFNYATGERMCHFENWTTSWILSAKSDYRRIVCTSQDGRALLLDFGHNVHGVDLLKSKAAAPA
ncbi:WD40 repeat-like protein [Pseudovirgaria hyperparasitica]|uniref:WD40 repeat-like protein n=1 Tax=Pseudovirgaria hyperparasitica TaxID=470096 RepID=A0A6A6W5X9_9PEZI|nr:WD40 repeat-like protein [Pseudovirgaria hyperparasitica]KAF2757955.1 WD40 repeat-like protein [Pseudovirgaria hyperparasitica]